MKCSVHHMTNSIHNIGLPCYRSMSYLIAKAEDKKIVITKNNKLQTIS